MKAPGEIPVDYCSGCGTLVALRPPTPEQPVSSFLCRTCGAVYFGADVGDATEPVIGLDKAVQLRICEVTIVPESAAAAVPPEHVRRLIKSLGGEKYEGPERRRDQRYAVTVPVVAVPLGQDFRIVGEPVKMTTLNVSLGGAALMHTRFTEAPYFALDFTSAGVELLQVVLQVLRVRNLGPLYEIGGRFISRLSQKA
jgi:hypothetical protein